jgi:hypothetical protein
VRSDQRDLGGREEGAGRGSSPVWRRIRKVAGSGRFSGSMVWRRRRRRARWLGFSEVGRKVLEAESRVGERGREAAEGRRPGVVD